MLDMPTLGLAHLAYLLSPGLSAAAGPAGPAGEKLPLEVSSAQLPRALPWENSAMNGILGDSLSGQ